MDSSDSVTAHTCSTLPEVDPHHFPYDGTRVTTSTQGDWESWGDFAGQADGNAGQGAIPATPDSSDREESADCDD